MIILLLNISSAMSSISNVHPYTPTSSPSSFKPTTGPNPISTGPGPVIPGGSGAAAQALMKAVAEFKAITIALSCVQVVLTVLPLIAVVMEMMGHGNKAMRILALVSLILMAGASVVKLITTSLFWSTSDARYVFPAILS